MMASCDAHRGTRVVSIFHIRLPPFDGYARRVYGAAPKSVRTRWIMAAPSHRWREGAAVTGSDALIGVRVEIRDVGPRDGLQVEAPNRCWVADLTNVQLPEGFVYLACILDLYSRTCIG